VNEHLPDQHDVLEALAQDARIRRMMPNLPTDRALSVEEVKEISFRFDQWCKEDRSRTLKSISRSLGPGYSEGTLSHFRTHPGDPRSDHEKVARAVSELMERHARREELKRPTEYVETEAAKMMLAAIKAAIDIGDMGLIAGPSGAGKTIVWQAATRLYRGSIGIRIPLAAKSARGVIGLLCEATGSSPTRSSSDLFARIVRLLKGSNRPILVDEFQHADKGGAEMLRDVLDSTGCPIILFDNCDALQRIDDHRAWFGQFSSRIPIRCNLTEAILHPKHPRPLFTHKDVQRFAESFSLKLSGDSTAFLTMLANEPALGGLRSVKQILMVVAKAPSLRSRVVGEADLKQVFREMRGLMAYERIQARIADRSERRKAAVG
jgi:DNA transposition AAA+ family ATPase